MTEKRTFAQLDKVKQLGDLYENRYELAFKDSGPLIRIYQGGWDADGHEFTVAYCGINMKPSEKHGDEDYFDGEVLGIFGLANFVRLCAALEFEPDAEGIWVIPEPVLQALRDGRKQSEDCTGGYCVGGTVIKGTY